MAFGQQSGPPATARQVQELLELLQAAGHADFRDARGPMGFTQRQAAGRFTRDEAAALLEQLQEQGAPAAAAPVLDHPRAASAPAARRPPAARRAAPRVAGRAAGPDLAAVPSEHLAAELQRRGWVVMEP